MSGRRHNADRSGHAWLAVRHLIGIRLAMSGSMPCPHCGEPVSIADPWDVDHRIPVAAGGTDNLANLTPAHRHCNRRAGAQARARKHPPPPSRTW